MPIEKRVLRIVSDTLKVPETRINTDDKLVSLVSYSIQLFELLIRFEKELGETIRYEDVAHIEKVSDIVEYATLRLGGASAS